MLSKLIFLADGRKSQSFTRTLFEDQIRQVKLLEYCNKLNKNIFLFGAQEDVLKKLVNVINLNYPNVHICGYENGYVENKQSVFEKIS